MWDGKLKAVEITPEILQKARDLRGNGASWMDVTRMTGVSQFLLRCELEPGYRDRRMMISKNSMARRRQGMVKRRLPAHYKRNKLSIADDGTRIGHQAMGDYGKQVLVPDSVEVERKRNKEFCHTDTTAALMGDPPTWRSALGKKAECL